MTRSRRLAYWVATVVAAAVFAVPGIMNVLRLPHIAADMAHLGYPGYLPSILGVWKILGALVVLLPKLPRLKEWAYAGMMFDLTGAALSRAAAHDGALMILVPLVIAAVVAISWRLRPAERALSVDGAFPSDLSANAGGSMP